MSGNSRSSTLRKDSAMQTVKTLEIDGTPYLLPAGFSDSKISELAGALLLLRRVDYCCDKDYRQSFHYAESDSVRVRLGTKHLYGSEQEAKAARDEHNATLTEQETVA
jgi:hypothetical protein